MKIMTEVVSAERLTNSTSGNPQWKVLTRTGCWKTKTDAQVAFTDFAELGHNGSKVELEVNGQGAIVGCEVI